ncbi:MAG: Type pilus assembly protein PilM [Verrucomicrobiales bacterium]|nr:Type pilus assembly protein PilM [Verrucomicrobiales bacterium]
MLQSKSFLAVDFGAGSLKLAEFEVNEAGGLRLKQYGIKSLGQEGAQENTREATILKALQAMISEQGFKPKDCNVCAPGFHVFSKFVKLPPVEQSKVTQIIQYEAQQNVPFPLSEVVWDYQILGQASGGELEVLLVAIKSEIVEGLFRVADAASLKLQVADVSPAALCNAFRFNYGDLEDCTMLLDIGAKTSNLLFFEKGKVYSRSINLGANSITQDCSAESRMKWDVAEKIKVEEGFVSLGGAYEEPENPNQAAISKIARQFMTRLHIQVNQTMQFYRGQQGGSQPARLFLSGGASIMPYTAQFFAEKLNVPVEYFNPFRNVQIDPAVNLEELARVAHSMGEVVGLGLRNLAHCPVELNLMPESTRKWRAFNEKKPFLIATVFTIVAVVAVIGLLFQQLSSVKAARYATIKPKVDAAVMRDNEFTKANGELNKVKSEMDQLAGFTTNRYYWVDTLPEIRKILMHVEAVTSNKWRSAAGVWIEQFVTPSAPDGGSATDNSYTGQNVGTALEQAIETKYSLAAGPPGADPSVAPVPPAPGSGVTSIVMVCRARKGADESANSDLMYAFLDNLKANPLFDPKATQVGQKLITDDSLYTFTFAVKVALVKPLKL